MKTPTRHRRPASKRIEIEPLESRQLLAAFGTPWPNPRELTISFPTDGVAIGQHPNDLHATLDTISARSEWQELALRAYQTWSVYADVNVGLRNDHNVAFGTAGMSVNDPRFGEFRIGAFPQGGVLANSIPFQASAGTYSGDLLLNSNEPFFYHDWAGGVPPAPSSYKGYERDLFSLLLHESGNTLGVDDNKTPHSVMFRQYTVPKGTLSQSDIDSIQAIYGARTDPFELVDNGQLQLATLVSTPVGFQTASDVISVSGSLKDAADVDYYEVTPASGQDDVTVRLRAAGISLLTSKVDVLDVNGNVLGSASAASAFDNDNEINLSGLSGHSVIYIRVASANQDIYGIGDYKIEVDYRDATVKASDPTPKAHDGGVDSLFTNFAIADDEQGINDTLASAGTLNHATGFAPQTRYEIVSAVSSLTDVDYLKVPGTSVAGRLMVHLSGVGLDQPGMDLKIVDTNDQPVGASGRLRPDGSWVLVVNQPVVNADYYLRISVDPTSAVSVGNYVASAEFVPSDTPHHMTSGSVSSIEEDFIRWTADKSKLFRFDLFASGGARNELARIVIYDAHTKEIKLAFAARSDAARSAHVWLEQGDYIIRFTAISRTGNPVDNINYRLECHGISDDQDPDDHDPQDDDGHNPYYYYEYQYYDYNTDPGSSDYYGYYYGYGSDPEPHPTNTP